MTFNFAHREHCEKMVVRSQTTKFKKETHRSRPELMFARSKRLVIDEGLHALFDGASRRLRRGRSDGVVRGYGNTSLLRPGEFIDLDTVTVVIGIVSKEQRRDLQSEWRGGRCLAFILRRGFRLRRRNHVHRRSNTVPVADEVGVRELEEGCDKRFCASNDGDGGTGYLVVTYDAGKVYVTDNRHLSRAIVSQNDIEQRHRLTMAPLVAFHQ